VKRIANEINPLAKQIIRNSSERIIIKQSIGSYFYRDKYMGISKYLQFYPNST